MSSTYQQTQLEKQLRSLHRQHCLDKRPNRPEGTVVKTFSIFSDGHTLRWSTPLHKTHSLPAGLQTAVCFTAASICFTPKQWMFTITINNSLVISFPMISQPVVLYEADPKTNSPPVWRLKGNEARAFSLTLREHGNAQNLCGDCSVVSCRSRSSPFSDGFGPWLYHPMLSLSKNWQGDILTFVLILQKQMFKTDFQMPRAQGHHAMTKRTWQQNVDRVRK